MLREDLAVLFRKSMLIRLMALYPPYLGAGIRPTRVSADFRAIDVQMRLHWWNQNYVGTHFGGSLFSMVDPYFMLMLIENLGPDYVVWDKAASIRFRKPGRGRVVAQFRLSEEQIEGVRATVAQHGRAQPTFVVEVRDRDGEVVAEVEKVLSVKLR